MKARSRLLTLGVLLLCVLPWLVLATPSYAEEGKATWYGPGFHGRLMANGQVFNMYDPTTTACNLYPLGTWLRVTNLANDKSIFVQVRDRGAFRIALDLSYAAFNELGGVGTMMQVRLEPVSGPDAAGEPSEETQATPAPTAMPTPEPTATPEPATPPEYTVQPGDTLSDIAARYGLSAEELATLNGIEDPNVIGEGQRLRLVSGERKQGAEQTTDVSSAASPETDSPSPAPQSDASAPYYHIVREGETLWGIALQYGLTADDLVRLNHLDGADSLQVSQKLYVCQLHQVAEGDTVSGIAAEYGVSAQSLMEANDLTADSIIQPGDTLRIPES